MLSGVTRNLSCGPASLRFKHRWPLWPLPRAASGAIIARPLAVWLAVGGRWHFPIGCADRGRVALAMQLAWGPNRSLQRTPVAAYGGVVVGCGRVR